MSSPKHIEPAAAPAAPHKGVANTPQPAKAAQGFNYKRSAELCDAARVKAADLAARYKLNEVDAYNFILEGIEVAESYVPSVTNPINPRLASDWGDLIANHGIYAASKVAGTCRSLLAERDALQRKCDQLQAAETRHAQQIRELLAALKRLASAVEALEGQEIEYRLAMELSNSAGAARAAIANVEGK